MKDQAIAISMDGRGRALDNVFIKRLWRSVKYECVYLHDYDSPFALNADHAEYFRFYNTKRPHQSLDYRMPAEIYFNKDVPEKGQSSAGSAGQSVRPTVLR